MPTLRGWIGGLGGAAAITIGVVVAALIVAGLTTFHGGDGHATVPAKPQRIALGADSALGSAVSTTSGPRQTQTSGRAARQGRPGSRVLASGGGPLSVRPGETQAPKQRVRGPGGDPHGSSSPVGGTPSGSTPSPGGGGSGPGDGGGDPVQQPSSLGGAVKNTTQQLGDTVNGVTQTVGNTVGTVSPALGNTVTQTGSALDNTVKGTGDLVGNTVNGLLGGHH